jgi:hypothetical protein
MKQMIFATILVLGFGFSAFAQTEKSPCSTIDVNGGGAFRPGEPTSFTAHIGDDANSSKFEYEWIITAGTIAAGQGTSTITVDTTGFWDKGITATVEIKGLPEGCKNTVSETTVCNCTGDPRLFDEIGKLPDSHIQARISNLYIELGNNSSTQGYIINYGTDKEIAVRERQINKAITSLKLDANRVTVVRGGENPNGAGVWTKVWILPPGAEFPKP